jgi:hypothetical protein
VSIEILILVDRDMPILIDRDISIHIYRDISIGIDRHTSVCIERDLSICIDRYMSIYNDRDLSVLTYRGISILIDRDITICIQWDIDIIRSTFMDMYPSRYNDSAPPFPILSLLNPIHTPPASLPKIHSDRILPSTPWSSEWFLSFGLPHQNFVHFLPCTMCATCPWDEYKFWSNFILASRFLLGTPSNKYSD